MINIESLMRTLASQRDAYYSEADFQHSLSWEVHKQFPKSAVRLERPIKANGKLLHLDFQIQFPDQSVAIELKYKTRNLVIESEGESYSLSNHGAQDFGRYDFIKDIVRLENITSSIEKCEGYAILLTNDNAYWKPRLKETADKAFNLTEGNILSGEMAWTETASIGTKRKRENSLVLSGTYRLNWHDYSVSNQNNSGQFRYLAIHIPAK